MSAPRRALITGIGGQDGSYLSELLLERGYEVIGVVRRPVDDHPALGGIRDRVVDRRGRPARPLVARRCAAGGPPARGLQSRGAVVRAALVGRAGADGRVRRRRRHLAARSHSGGRSRRFASIRRPPARSSATRRSRRRRRTTPLRPVTPYGVAKAYAHFIAHSYRRRYGMFTCCGILYNHESPRRPLDFLPAQGGALRGRDLARARARARPRRSRLASRLGVCRRLRPGDVADAPAGRARPTTSSRPERAIRCRSSSSGRSRTSGSTGAITSAATRRSGEGLPSSTISSATRRARGSASAGSRRSTSTGSFTLLVDAELDRLRAQENIA